MLAVADQLPWLGKRELICLLSFTCNYVVSIQRGFLFLLAIGMGCVIFCGTPWAFHIVIMDNCYWQNHQHYEEILEMMFI